MRVTQKILTDRAMWNLNHILSRVIRTQDELSSGKQVLAPSDSPVKINHILSLRTSINRLDQYRDNIQDAINWLNLVDQSIDSSVAVNQVVQTIALQAANGTLTYEERKILATQVENYLEEMVGNGNISFGDKYLFAGTETLTRPFAVTSGAPEDQRIKTSRALDLAIQGSGYFQLVKFDKGEGYNRIGSGDLEDYEFSASGTFQINGVEIEVVGASNLEDLASSIEGQFSGTPLDGVIIVEANTANNTLEFRSTDGSVITLQDGAEGLLTDWGMLDEDGTINPANSTLVKNKEIFYTRDGGFDIQWTTEGYNQIGSRDLEDFDISASGTFQINGVEIEVGGDSTLEDLASSIEGQFSGTPLEGVISASATNNTLEFRSTDGSVITLQDGEEGLLTSWGMLDGNGDIVPDNSTPLITGQIVNRENIPLLVTGDGTVDSDPLIIPRDHKSIEISQDGTVTVTLADDTEEEYFIHLARFMRTEDLTEAGSGLYRKADTYTGTPIIGSPGTASLGILHSGYLETSARIAYYGNSGIIVHEVESETNMKIGFPGDEVFFRGFQAVGKELSVDDIREGVFSFSVNGREVTIDNEGGPIKTAQQLADQLNLAFNRDTQLRQEVYAATDRSRLILRSRTEDILEFTEIEGTPLQDWGIIGYSQVKSDTITASATGVFQINDIDIVISIGSDDAQELADEINAQLRGTPLQSVVFVSASTANNTLEFYTNDQTILELKDGTGDLLSTWGMLDEHGMIEPENAARSVIIRPEEAEGVLKEVRDMEYYLRTNDFQKISSVGLQGLKDSLDTLVRVRSQAGARTLRMETHLTRYDGFSVDFKRLLSQKEDIDVAEVVMRLKEHENVYQMALAATARAIQPTLLNFLR